MIIYKITNKINDKVYIGQTFRTIEVRWKQHCISSSKCKYLSKAIKKYGKENFKIELLEVCKNQNHLNLRERYWILFFNCLAPVGYNLSYGGQVGPMVGRKHSIKTKKAISIKLKGVKKKPISEQHRKNLSNSLKGQIRGPRSEEVKQKISLANSGKNHWMYGKKGFDCCNSKPILCTTTGMMFGSTAEAARELNLSQPNITKVLLNQRQHTGNLQFKYLEAYND